MTEESAKLVLQSDGGRRYSPHDYVCPNGCYIPLIDRMYASHRHECPECGDNLRRRNDVE